MKSHENKYKKLAGHNLDFEKEIDQEDIDKLLEIASEKVKTGLITESQKPGNSYKFMIAAAYEMLAFPDSIPWGDRFREIITQEEKDMFIKLYKKYELK